MEIILIIGAVLIVFLAPWAKFYVLTAQKATAYQRRDKELAQSEYATTRDLRDRVERLTSQQVALRATLAVAQAKATKYYDEAHVLTKERDQALEEAKLVTHERNQAIEELDKHLIEVDHSQVPEESD